MIRVSTLSLLEQWSPQSLATLVAVLTDRAIATDEDETDLVSWMIEGWDSSCDSLLNRCGYGGGALSKIGDYFPEHGAIYCIYDAGRVDLQEALLHLNEIAKRSMLNRPGISGDSLV